MTEAELRARLAGHSAHETQDDGDIPGTLIPAAVLVAVTPGPGAGVLLTKRHAGLRQHAGQVAFPGGRIDPGEKPEQAALREACEECGLEPGHVEILGRLAAHVTGTGYRVTPVTALLAPGYVARPAPAEVEAVFSLPLATVLDPAAPRTERMVWRGRERHFTVWPHPEFYVWGATGAILLDLARRLRGEPDRPGP